MGCNETTGQRWALWEERLESVKRAAFDPNEPAWRENHSIVLLEVEPDVWLFDHGDGWPSFMPCVHPSQVAQLAPPDLSDVTHVVR